MSLKIRAVKSRLWNIALVLLGSFTGAATSQAQTYVGGYTLSYKEDLTGSAIKQQNFYFPDGGISVVQNNIGWITTMAGSSSYIYKSSAVWPQNATGRLGGNFGASQPNTCYADNGGKWLNNIARINWWDGNNLIGFYHVEDHWCPKAANDGRYWASVGVVYSENGGTTFTSLWGKPEGYIIKSSLPKPATKTASGGAGNSTVFKGQDQNWYAIYSEYDSVSNNYALHIARSQHPNAAPGTFYKYNNGVFSTDALQQYGGKTALKNSADGKSLVGANPSVQWNSKIGKYVMVWHKWGGSINAAVSRDLITWTNVQTILTGYSWGPYYAYPSLISPEGSDNASNWTRLYYAEKVNQNDPSRKLMVQTLDLDLSLGW